MPEPPSPAPRRMPTTGRDAILHVPEPHNHPLTAPRHGWFTSPARSHASSGYRKELPLHLIQLILEYLDDAADLARVTRTSRLFYYMTLPRLYENVTLRSYSELRYIDDRPVGFGGGSPFAVGLNTLVSRAFPSYIRSFRVVGEWREHDVEDYSKGRVPDNSMMLQVAMRAALDKMVKLEEFAWELGTKPLQTVYEGLMHKSNLTTLTLRCPSRRIPRPTTVVPPLPNLKTLIVYDIDPLCYPDNISLLLLTSKKLENLKLHWHPRMRETGEESVNLLNYFGRCIAAKHRVPIKRLAFYNLYARNQGDGFETVMDNSRMMEVHIINSMGSADPMNVFLDNTWKINGNQPVPHNLKVMRIDTTDKEHVRMMYKFSGLEQLSSMAPTPTSPSNTTTPATVNGVSAPSGNGATASGSAAATNGTPITESQCKSLAGEYLAVIQSNHRTMRYLLLSDRWQLSPSALFKLCQSCPNLEQLGFACNIPPLESLRQIIALCPKLWAIRLLVQPGSPLAEQVESLDSEIHQFMFTRELWRPEYLRIKYFGLGDVVFKLGGVITGQLPAGAADGEGEKEINGKKLGPLRRMERVDRSALEGVEIWGMDNVEFEAKF
ncbi:hypothetical protein P280DRAFT_487666 [Massarina eburnea CBS 473.64]|uniref:F-box domain-containing protein n=1 Tax=Massarina eburnea CBS 473.64 TaxID=1395130 RepID=A0A6A6SBC8_9PLEO|nr:hypothetical protein P280DRAFT_487666 [Massarina eburnea CBS 473.64]